MEKIYINEKKGMTSLYGAKYNEKHGYFKKFTIQHGRRSIYCFKR